MITRWGQMSSSRETYKGSEDEYRTRVLLQSLYEPHNKKLFELLHQVYNISLPPF